MAEALRRLDEEPRYVVLGTDALQAWMQELSDRVVDALADTHFEIDEPLRNLECRIAPTQTGGIYYTGPSEDLTRPGRMWWSVPPGVDTFHTWQETTTVFHEGVPGHHLQIGRAVVLADQLNRWRRLGCWVSGHGEGWALYAERLMAELGWLDDAGNRMGMLDAQRFRAARVVIDIGVHCGMTAPDGGIWDADKAWVFLQSHSAMKDANLHFELDRYLGWPGQAPSYAIGQRIWQQLRDEMVGGGAVVEGIPPPRTGSRRPAAGRAQVGVVGLSFARARSICSPSISHHAHHVDMVPRFADSESASTHTVAAIRSRDGIANRHTEPDHVARQRLAGLRLAGRRLGHAHRHGRAGIGRRDRGRRAGHRPNCVDARPCRPHRFGRRTARVDRRVCDGGRR